jgi:hypothetical protein
MTEIVNANDAVLTVEYNDVEASAGPDGRLLASDVSITRNRDLTSHSGIGRHAPKGISLGNVEYEWEFTLEGEDAELFTSIAADNGEANVLQMTLELTNTKAEVDGAYTGEDVIELSDGEVGEMTFSGMATGVDTENTV